MLSINIGQVLLILKACAEYVAHDVLILFTIEFTVSVLFLIIKSLFKCVLSTAAAEYAR